MPALNTNINPLHALGIVAGFFVVIGLVGKFAESKRTYTASAPAAPLVGSGTFDVPALVGLDIKGVVAKLGAPDTPLTPDPNLPSLKNGMLKTWDVTWKKGRNELLVQYEIRTLRVVDYFIPTSDPTGATSNPSEMRSLGNLIEVPTRYTLIPVPAVGRTGQYAGLKIVPR
jgi:hypothetical protein